MIAAFKNPAVLILALSFHASWQALCTEPIALYRFNTDGEDSLGQNQPFVLTNSGAFTNRGTVLAPFFTVATPPFTNGVLYVNGLYEPNGGLRNYLGTPPLKGFDYDAFTVAFDFCPLPLKRRRPRLESLENKLDFRTHGRYGRWFGLHSDPNLWDTSNIITGGYNYRWIGFNRQDGVLNLTLNDRSFTHRFGSVSVSPNHWHNLICSVDLRHHQILVWFDGRQLETVRLPEGFKLDVVGSSGDQSAREFTFTDYSNGSVYLGYVANLRLFRGAMSESEIAGLSALFPTERPAFVPGQSFPWQIFLTTLTTLAVVALLTVLARRRAANDSKS